MNNEFIQAVAKDVDKKAAGKGNKRGQGGQEIELITSGQTIPASIGENFWVIGG